MEVSYKKDMDKSFMLIKGKFSTGDYRTRMVCNNNIPGFNKASIKQFNNEIIIYYDISGKMSMINEYAVTKMRANDIRNYIMGIQRMQESVKQYMLDLNKVILDLDFVYIKKNDRLPQFCYYPQKEESFYKSLQKVFDKMIEVADHSDRETVIVSYGLQQLRIGESNITLNEIIQFLNESRQQENEIEDNVDKYNTMGNNISEYLCDEEMGYREEDNHTSVSMMQRIKETISGSKTKIIDDYEKSIWNENGPIWSFKRIFNKMKNKYKTEQEIVAANQVRSVRMHDNIRVEKNKEQKQKDNSKEYDATELLRNESIQCGIVLKCTDIERAQTIVPNDFPCILGKSKKSADYIIEDKTISRVHVRIHEEETGYYIEDLNSTNGTYVNNEKLAVHELKKINIGDIIRLAEIEYLVC